MTEGKTYSECAEHQWGDDGFCLTCGAKMEEEPTIIPMTAAAGWRLMPPLPSACPVCARDPAHAAHEPHDAMSLFYQYNFHLQHGRFPTWVDAMAHCTPEMQAAWEAELRKRGHWPGQDDDA